MDSAPDLLRALGVGVCTAAASLVLRGCGRRDVAILCEITGGAVLLSLIIPSVREAAQQLLRLQKEAQTQDVLVCTLLKCAGVAMLTDFGAQFCRDAECAAVAQKVELAGKVVILCAALPMLIELCQSALSLLP